MGDRRESEGLRRDIRTELPDGTEESRSHRGGTSDRDSALVVAPQPLRPHIALKSLLSRRGPEMRKPCGRGSQH